MNKQDVQNIILHIEKKEAELILKNKELHEKRLPLWNIELKDLEVLDAEYQGRIKMLIELKISFNELLDKEDDFIFPPPKCSLIFPTES